MIYVTFTYKGVRYAKGCDCAAEANMVYCTARNIFDRVSINFTERISKDVVKLSEDEFSHMTDEIIYNE